MSVLASLFGKETLVGLDIGSANLKAVQVDAHRDGFRVVRAAQQKTPPGAIRDGVVIDREAVGQAIRQMLKAANVSATGAVVSVAGPTVVVRQVQMPTMPEPMLRKSIRFEAGRFISSNVEDSALAFEILGPDPEDPGQMNVMLVAAPREMVDSRVAALERAGLEAVAVDVEAFALVRSLAECNWSRYNDGTLRAIVDIGASHTEVTITLGTQFQLTRSLPIAGDTFTDALKNQLRVDIADAERRKAELDLNVLVQGGESAAAYDAPRAVQNILDELLREIRRSINYYQSQLPEGASSQPLSEIILAGGSAQMTGLAPYMTARLGTEVRVGDPFENPAIDAAPEATAWLQEQAPRLGTALGLAVKEFMVVPGVK
ncbi:MAG TPA: type IV pilus assembly protein PilM [Armatimonadaceae bacterium]|nr:type IV pilus assembly protein PilM [Armatimonadaceae bacterium]